MLRKGMFISDRYEIIDKVGSGGMSDVYKAKCHKLNRFVAIKVLKAEFSEDKNFVSKFKVEAQSAAGLAHPNIVSVFDVGEDNGIHYIVMELVEGITLKKYIEKKGRLSTKEAVSIAIQVAQGIEAAHNNHIIHRDIKPQNIIISREGKVKVTDFGIARAASSNTINSNAMGSVHYISPEQARGGFIDEKSDIYSLGITLYEMITGSVPFEGDSTVTVALQHIQGEIPSPREVVDDLPISVEKIIEKCTQKKTDRRYPKVSLLIADLKHSLISPDEDFVEIAPVANNQSTVVISDAEVALIRKETGRTDEDFEEIDENTADFSTVDDDDEYDDDEEDNPKLDKIVAIGGIVTGVLVLVVVIFLAVSIFKNGTGGDSKKPEETTTLDANHTIMPDLTGMTEEEAIEA
ncbi:MAG: Stk1 family PASTA domain-containing Ser/Thr kinase, partial [Lachnospiraceae bacterium]|nr:Stk1 family PASTA domain-containing Ser/Thr kinase [Lachnospiraceae bacterium]